MIYLVCLLWIGFKLHAPGWYFGLLIFAGLLNLVSYGLKMYRIGAKNKQKHKMLDSKGE